MAPRSSDVAFRAALQELQHGIGQPLDAETVDWQPEEVALESRFRATEAAAAALAAGGLLADRIAAGRGHRRSRVVVGGRHVAASLTSFAHLQFLDPERAPPGRLAPEARTAAAGFFATADRRWVYLHPGFSHNTQGLLTLLGVADRREEVRAAVAARRADALEDAMAEAGLCGAMVRSPEEWDESHAGRLLAARPVVEVIQLGDSPPEPFPVDRQRPLAGIRVLDLTRILAGPTCGRTLAAYGAEVLRIGAERLPSIPLFVADTGFGKRSAHLDLRRPDAEQTLRRLVREADVFCQGYRTGAMDRLGFGVTDVAQLRPGVIYVSVNCYGHEGPWRARPGWEQLAQTVTGMAHVQGCTARSDGTAEEERRPVLLPAAVTDYTTGYLAACGALAALERRSRHGGSYWVRVSLARTGMWVRGLGLRRTASARPLTTAELDSYRDRVDTPWGAVNYLRPAVALTHCPVHWALPPVPLGTHPAAFR